MDAPHRHSNWKICFQELAPKLVLFARQWVPSFADAEDVVQNAFVRFWRHRPDAQPEHYPLLYAAVRTAALDYIRGSERRMRRENDDRATPAGHDEPFFDTTIEQRERAEAIQTALQRLPEAQREVLVLRIWGDLTFAQIAETLDESINTVASRYRYAVQALRESINPHEFQRA